MTTFSFESLGPELASALTTKGFTSLTPVQHAVLEPAARGRDLRIRSQTGSGKTVALGLAIRDLLEGDRAVRALVLAPTRELARQVQAELAWLFAPMGAEVASLTGGASYRDEHRALAARPAIVVGTPGRVLDHLERGTLDVSTVRAVVLDEADRMLDLGFREPIETILARTPADRRTHLVSATFADEVLRLADRVQRDPMSAAGSPAGAANRDIDHVAYVVPHAQRLDAIVNLLLAHEEKALVFARTRADVAVIADGLGDAGFAAAPLSGELEQRDRTRALGAFAKGAVRVLVATDVAARGLDVPDVGLVIHADAPTDADGYTHRSGRTGRAGRKGTSAIVLTPREMPLVRRVLSRASIRARFEPVPSEEEILRARDARAIAVLTGDEGPEIDARTQALARELASRADLERTIARLLAGSERARAPAPRAISGIAQREAPRGDRDGRARPFIQREALPDDRKGHARSITPREAPRDDRDGGASPIALRSPHGDRSFALFHVTWGERQGADARRMLAMICRRGRVASHEVGAIRVGANASEVQIASEAAARFAEATRRRDPRDPAVAIRPGSTQAR